ncbi:MAG: hypothetical protein LBC20_16215 [Planctomycetaceae bacterium]|jgi:hypothetical protein|nr:hypothetical protein [Planctomycetaceae bacterium]
MGLSEKKYLSRAYRLKYHLIISVIFTLILIFGTACHLIKKPEPTTGKSIEHLLQQGQTSSDSVGIEIFTIRTTPQQQELVRQLWLEVDEQMIAPPLRRELMEQGIRMGVLGDLLTPALSQLIHVTGDAKAGNVNMFSDFQEVSVAEIPHDPPVTRQYRNLLPDMRASLKAFEEPVPELSRFWFENGQFCGQTYKDALGLICVNARNQNNGTVRFDIVPELEYGTMERHIRIHSAMMIPENGRPRLPFVSLTVTQNLLSGQWILMGPTTPNCSGIGRVLFIRGNEEPELKILAIRLIKMKKNPPNGSNIPEPEKGTEFLFPERN